MRAHPLLSIVTPAFNEAANLRLLYERLCRVCDGAGWSWEWVVVDDHSRDATFDVVRSLSAADARVSGVRLARNAGSHVALGCGLAHARGLAAVLLVADGQDPPEVLPALVTAWRAGAQVVWAARDGGLERVPWSSRLFYRTLRRVAGLAQLPPQGADCVLLDRVVIDAMREFREHHVNLLALISWMGFRQASVPCARAPRQQGHSGWSLAKKLRLVVDSVTAFTFVPIRVMSALGVLTALAGFAYMLLVLANAWRGAPPTGWSSLMVAVLLVGGMQMTMLGVLGEYLWRALEEGRRRPRYLIEETTEAQPALRAGALR